MQPQKTPTFLSLVGINQNTDALFEALKRQAPEIFPGLKFEFIDSPFVDYAKVHYEDGGKRALSPLTRLHIGWGFFHVFNLHTTKRAFESGVDVVIIRQFGFDLYAGAIAHQD